MRPNSLQTDKNSQTDYDTYTLKLIPVKLHFGKKTVHSVHTTCQRYFYWNIELKFVFHFTEILTPLCRMQQSSEAVSGWPCEKWVARIEITLKVLL